MYFSNNRSNKAIELNPTNFYKLIEEKEPKLKGFFDELENIQFLNDSFALHRLAMLLCSLSFFYLRRGSLYS